ncbi:hypothetical protein [Brachybacterium sp. AOP35-5H-19]|uniref:hypothetical protein n=1 Tax=Brachybacterium sp. AOP35-5H-19 TaxID=3457685 RepID=UPI004034060E
MGIFAEVVNGVLRVLLLGFGASLLLTVAWSTFAVSLAGAVRSAYRAVDARLPFWVGTLDQILLCITAVAITSLITVFPHIGLWAAVVERTSDTLGDNAALLGAAAALLALLLFAATQARSAEREARSGGVFYGRALSTSQFTRSQWAMLLRLPAFQVMTVLLFIIPIALTVAPSTPPEQFLGVELAGIPPLDRILSASWCALFAIVGGVLILNATSSLRSSVLEVMDPLRAHQQIQDDVEDDSRRAWNRWATSRPRGRSSEPEEWVTQHISFAKDLPAEEQAAYVRATVGNVGLNRATWAQFVTAERDLKRAARFTARARRNRSTQRLAQMRRNISGWRGTRRAKRAKSRLEAVQSAHQAMVVACADAFESQHLSGDIRRELIRSTQRSAAAMDRMHRYLEQALERTAQSFGTKVVAKETARGALPVQVTASSTSEVIEATRVAMTLHNLLLSQERELPSLRSSLPLPWNEDEGSPEVLRVSALSYRALAIALFPRFSPERTSATAGIPLRELLTIADSIGHDQTRAYALDQLISSFMDCVILHRNDDEPIEISALESFVPRRNAPDTDLGLHPSSAHRPLSTIIEDCASSFLMDNTGLAPEKTATLLKLVKAPSHYSALLFDLTYARASSKRLPAHLLEPFSVALRFRSISDDAELQEIQEHIVRAFSSSFASHLLSPRAIRWLVGALQTRLTVELCQQFEEEIAAHRGRSFGILQFIQWHLLAGIGFGTSAPRDGHSEAAPTGSMLGDAKVELWRFYEEWEQVDRHSASSLGLFLFNALGYLPDDTSDEL